MSITVKLTLIMEKQERKKYKKHEEEGASQKMFSFRLDMKHWSWLQSKANKGRYINELIARDKRAAWLGDDEHTDDLQRMDDYEP